MTTVAYFSSALSFSGPCVYDVMLQSTHRANPSRSSISLMFPFWAPYQKPTRKGVSKPRPTTEWEAKQVEIIYSRKNVFASGNRRRDTSETYIHLNASYAPVGEDIQDSQNNFVLWQLKKNDVWHLAQHTRRLR